MHPSLPAAEPFGDRRGGKSEIVAGGENDPVVSGKRMEKGVHRMRKLPCLNDLLHIVPSRDALGELVERGGRLTAAAFLRAVGAKAGKGGVRTVRTDTRRDAPGAAAGWCSRVRDKRPARSPRRPPPRGRNRRAMPSHAPPYFRLRFRRSPARRAAVQVYDEAVLHDLCLISLRAAP